MTYIQPAEGPAVSSRDALREELARGAVANGTATLSPVLPAPSGNVDPHVARQLVDAATSYAARAFTPGLSDAERLARAAAAGDAARDLRDNVALLDVYARGRHSRLRDLATLANPRAGAEEREAASTRLDLDRQHRTLVRAWGDLGSATMPSFPQAGAPSVNQSPAAWLNSPYVAPADEPLGRGRLIAEGWSNLPTAFLDQPFGTDVSAGGAHLFEGDEAPWHHAGLAVNLARQVIDWASDGGKETEAMIAASVDVRLEGAMLADLTAGAPTAASFAAAETAAGTAWTAGADLILVSGADRPKVVRAYTAEGIDPADRPTILATAGATPGTAIVLASGAVRAEASGVDWLLADEPAVFGKAVAAIRYGLARPRVAGAVQKVTVPA